MSLRLAANISMLFREATTLTERMALAKQAGFVSVESISVYDEPIEQLVKAQEEHGLQFVLINMPHGEGGKGAAALPDKVKAFKDDLELAIKYAKALKCPRIHMLSGCKSAGYDESEMEKTYIINLQHAANRLQKEGLTGTIEPLNTTVTAPNYFLDHPAKAVGILEKLNHPCIKLQLDIFHLQLIAGNLTANIKKYLPYADHVQIAQAPHRGSPGSAGEIQYPYILQLLKDLEYKGWVGLEYLPSGSTSDSLDWIKDL